MISWKACKFILLLLSLLLKCVWGTGASPASCLGSRSTTNHSLFYSQQGVRIRHESSHAGYTEYTDRYFVHVHVSVCVVMLSRHIVFHFDKVAITIFCSLCPALSVHKHLSVVTH